MNKNLVIVCAGPNSLHKNWINKNKNFDLFLVYYGDSNEDLYIEDADYYTRKKGTKFNIVAELDIPNGYDFIFVPDDDLYMSSYDIDNIFNIAKEYDIWLCQPSLAGYYSVDINLHRPDFILRYTNYVEIICPCFNKYSFDICKKYFNYNKSCWGIERLWVKELGEPKDKIAILDDIVVVHTRPCFMGDYYENNKIEKPEKDLFSIMERHKISWEIKHYGSIIKNNKKEILHKERFYPYQIKSFFDNYLKKLNKKFLI